MKRILVSFAALSAFALPVAGVACSSSSSGNNPSDAGGSETSTNGDSSTPGTDGGGNTGNDGGLPDGATPPQGTQIVQTGDSLTVYGTTKDGYVIYSDDTSTKLNAVPVAGGGMPMDIGGTQYMGSADVGILGATVLVWTGSTTNNPVGSLAIWNKADGTLKQVSTASLDATVITGTLDVAADGSKIIFIDNATFTAGAAGFSGKGDLTVVNADGTGKTALVTGVNFDSANCGAFARFVGSAAVATYCASAPPDAGAPDGGAEPIATLSYFASATGTPTVVSPAAFSGFAQDQQGTQVLYFNANGGWLWKLGMAGAGTAVTGPSPTAPVFFSNDGSGLIFLTSGGALETATVASPTGPTTLASGLAGVQAVSPDGKWLLANKMSVPGGNTGFTKTDLYVASTTTAGTPATLTSTANAVLFPSTAAFTADSSQAVWYENVDPMLGTGDLYVAGTSMAMPTKVAGGVWANLAATGTKMVFNYNCNGCSASSATPTAAADLVVKDLATTAAPTIVSSLANTNFFVSTDKTSGKATVVYTWNYLMGPMTGIWAYPVQ